MPLTIPTEVNEPPVNLFDYTTLVYGEKGIGKTSLLAQFPDCLVFMFEPRRRNLRIRQVWYAGQGLPDEDPEADKAPLDWLTFEAYVQSFLSQEQAASGVKTIAIDSLDRAYQRCLEQVCAEAGFTHPNDANDYGKTWQKIKERFEGTLTSLAHAGYGVTLTSHGKRQRVEPPMGDAFDQQGITASGSAKDVADVLCDFVIYYGYHGNSRTFTVRGNQAVYASCGVTDRFLDTQGRMLQTFDAGASPEMAYANLIDGFNNEMNGIVWVPPPSVCESFEAKEALEALPKVPDTRKTVRKVLAKAI